MEIQKVISDHYDTERLYSVLMSEDELRLFSDLSETDEDRLVLEALANKKDLYSHSKLKNSLGFGALGAGLGTVAGAGIGHVVGKGRLKKHDIIGAAGTLYYPIIGNVIGGTAGTGFGYYRGNKKQKKAEKEYEEAVAAYLAATKKKKPHD